jgi:hypothetical protein
MILEALLDRIAEKSNGVFDVEGDWLIEVNAIRNYEIIAELHPTSLEFGLHNGNIGASRTFQADFANPVFDPESFCDYVAKELVSMIGRSTEPPAFGSIYYYRTKELASMIGRYTEPLE